MACLFYRIYHERSLPSSRSFASLRACFIVPHFFPRKKKNTNYIRTAGVGSAVRRYSSTYLVPPHYNSKQYYYLMLYLTMTDNNSKQQQAAAAAQHDRSCRQEWHSIIIISAAAHQRGTFSFFLSIMICNFCEDINLDVDVPCDGCWFDERIYTWFDCSWFVPDSLRLNLIFESGKQGVSCPTGMYLVLLLFHFFTFFFQGTSRRCQACILCNTAELV